jgi:hypothetical protein
VVELESRRADSPVVASRALRYRPGMAKAAKARMLVEIG